MEGYMFSVLILGGIIILKLGIILCLYACRNHRLKKMRRLQTHTNAGGATAYPQPQYNQHSAIVNYEESPGAISHVSSNDVPYPPAYLQPPSYNDVVSSEEDKPPSYEQVTALPSNNMVT